MISSLASSRWDVIFLDQPAPGTPFNSDGGGRFRRRARRTG